MFSSSFRFRCRLLSWGQVHLALVVLLMFASAASGVESATSLSAGTVIYLRVSTPVSSKTSKNQDTVKATVARDVTTPAGVVIPAGAVVSGRVEKLVRSSLPDERDRLRLSFTRLALPDKSNLQLAGGSRLRGRERPRDDRGRNNPGRVGKRSAARADQPWPG